ncbi:putative methyl-accepting chemotaxis protein [Pillotina sp. SPG140]
MKIGIKLVSMISICNIIAIVFSAGVTLSVSQKEISKLAEEQAESLAEKGVEEIKSWFGAYVDTIRALANMMEGYKDIPAEERRMYFDLMLKQVFIAHPEVSSVYANWAPNALDGMDAEYVGSPGADPSGRYVPAWTHGSDGPALVAIRGFPFEAVMQVTGGEEFVFEPEVRAIGNNILLIANICTPVKDNGTMVGITGIVFELPRIQAIAEAIKPLGDGYTMVFSSGGLIAAHPDPERLGKNIKETESDTFGSSLDILANAVTTGKPVAFSVPSPQGTMQYYSLPFSIGKNPKPWTLVVGVSRNTIMAPVYRILTITLIIGILSIFFMAASSVFIARSVSKPIAYTMSILTDVAHGDLTKQLVSHSKDELGDLARYLNWTIDKIKSLVFAIRTENDMLSQTGVELAAHATETAAAITEITANIQSIKARMRNQSSSVTQTTATMNRIVNHINTLGQLVDHQTTSVSKSSTSIEAMVANIHHVTQTLVKNVNNIISLSESSEVGRRGLQEVSADIQEIAHESEGLLEINAVMESIASQTNLLSMNAAIEAAHAGETGKGFAVVAGEIRKLAESSAAQSQTISIVLKKIKDSIDKITKSTEGVLLKFELIREGIETVTEQEKAVRAAMEEQGVGSKSILEAIGQLKEMTGQVKQRAGEMLEGSEEVIGESRSLEHLTEEITGGMNEIATGAEQINSSMEQVAGISTDNRERITALGTEVSKFKV